MTLSLDRLALGAQGRIECLDHTGTLRRRLADLGFQPGACVQCVGVSPLGDPRAYLVCGAVIALRNRDCRSIRICTEKEARDAY